MKEDKRLQELLNREPKKWGNVSIKEFERDITLLQNEVLILRERLTEQEDKTKSYINKWVSSLVDNLELMDEYMPEWRLHTSHEIDQLRELLG